MPKGVIGIKISVLSNTNFGVAANPFKTNSKQGLLEGISLSLSTNNGTLISYCSGFNGLNEALILQVYPGSTVPYKGYKVNT